MVNEGKSASDLLDAIIGLMYIFLVFMIIILAVSMKENWFGAKPSTKPKDLLPADYFDVIEPWGETTFISTEYPGGDSIVTIQGSTIDLSVCTWFTYQNLLDINKMPSLQNAIVDFENGFSHLSPPQSCIDSDQIVFKRAKRTCDGKGIAECIGVDGSRFNKNKVELYNYPCSDVIPPCSGSVGGLSFNFFKNIRGRFSMVNSLTRVMTIETIFVSPATLAELDSNPENQFYTRQGQIFTTSNVYDELGNEQYYPLITYQGKQTNNFKQAISLRRYNHIGGNYVESESGPYGEIIFRPGNLYLDAETNTASNQIDSFVEDNAVDAVLYRDQFKIRKMYRISDPPVLIDTTCTGYIIGGIAYVSIYRRGSDPVSINEKLLILADDNVTKTLMITVTTVFDFSIFLIFKPIKNGVTPRKWLLIPPLDIGGGKVIPRKDRSSYIRVFNSPPFDNELYDLAKDRSSQGAERGTESQLRDAYNRRDPLTTFRDGLYSSSNIKVNRGTKALVRKIADSRPGSDQDILPNLNGSQIVAWWEIMETSQKDTKYGDRDRKSKVLTSPIRYVTGGDTFQGGVYPNDQIENYLISIGDRIGQVDPISSPFYTIQPFLGWKSRRTGTFNDTINSKAMLSLILEEGSPNLTPGNRYVDGSVIWELVNPKYEIAVYTEEYFYGQSVTGGGISDFVPTEASTTQKYKQDQDGVLFQIIFFGYSLDSDSESAIEFIENYTGSFTALDVVDESGKGFNATATVHFIDGKLIGITLQNQGTDYKTGSSLSITISQTDDPVKIINLLADSENISYTYVAIPQDQESNTYFDLKEIDTKKITKTGFSIGRSSVEIIDGQLTLKRDTKKSILTQGSGYTIDNDPVKNIVYIDQIDQFGNSSITERVPSSFYSFNITEIFEDVVPIKTKALFSQAMQERFPNFVEYNFYEGESHGRKYGKSPQQVGFIDDPEITKYIRTGSENEFKSYIYRNASQPFNNFLGITTLQFERLNYTQHKTQPPIQARANLVLGKFIPYTEFYSENLAYVNNEDETLRNYNYVQFIPNSISNIYSREIDEDVLPTF